MAFEPLTFTCSWENPRDFPTYEPNEQRVRADLQRLHNECRDGLNRLIEGLNDPAAANHIPFHGEGLEADNLQDAILETFEAVQNAAAGLIVNGSVTKEKLSPELLERVYGGRTWVSMDVPGVGENPDTGFPVGQLWLRPGFTVENLGKNAWSTSGCTLTEGEDGLRLTGTGTLASVSAAQTLTGLGKAGQQVYVVMKAKNLDRELTGLTLYVQGQAHDLMTGGGVFASTLNSTGALTLTLRGQWPSASLATGSATLGDFAVVNSQKTEEALPGCKPMTHWPDFLAALGKYQTVKIPGITYIQAYPGEWMETDLEVLPVERGGTGLRALEPGQMLYAGEDGKLHCLDAPSRDSSVLEFQGGKPVWIHQEQLVADTGSLRLAHGSYVGNEESRSISLPAPPHLILIYGSGLTAPVVLGQNTSHMERCSAGDYSYFSRIALEENTLVFSMEASSEAKENGAVPEFGNRTGETYAWTAVV